MSLGIDRTTYSNAVQAKVVYAGSNNTSYSNAKGDLHQLAEIEISDKQVRRLCNRIGNERVDERDAAVATYQALPLVERKSAPVGIVPPALAVVGVDGGRMQVYDRSLPGGITQAKVTAGETLPQPDVVLAGTVASPGIPAALGPDPPTPSAADNAPLSIPAPAVAATKAAEEDDEERRGRFWREDKIGLLMTMASEVSTQDPCPRIPETFLHPGRMTKLVRGLKKRAPPREEAVQETDDVEAGTEALRDNDKRWEPPEVQAKQLVATRRSWDLFGPMVAAAAWALGYFAAQRKAFIGDGAENNWTVHRLFFSSFVPILDFIHALSYVFASAMAGRGFKEGWVVYERWIQWVWSGEVAKVIEELAARQVEVGMPTKDETDGSPQAVVARALTYLRNNRERMHYAEYRRQGMPITSSYVESAVKQINKRVKGTEKFWNEAGAEALLQLRADYLSAGDIMGAFWKRREISETGQNRYRQVG